MTLEQENDLIITYLSTIQPALDYGSSPKLERGYWLAVEVIYPQEVLKVKERCRELDRQFFLNRYGWAMGWVS